MRIDLSIYRSIWFITAVTLVAASAACSRPAPAKTYPIRGQILAVDAARQQLTIKHDDIDGLMPGMTMSFPVAKPELLTGREPGELITGTLEVSDALGRITAIERVGFESLPTNSNAALMAGSLLDVGDAVPDAALIDQTNRRRMLSEWNGSATLVTFIYTQCPLPNFCPLMDQNFAKLQQAIVADPALRAHARLMSISFDPDHDTPEVLAAHAQRLKADPTIWTFLTGDRATVDKVAARMGVGVIRDPAPPGGAPPSATAPSSGITHNLRTILVGADGKIAHIYSGNDWTTAAVLVDLRAAAAAARLP